MELTGTHNFEADAKAIWHALLDPKVLKTCVPGAILVEGSAEEGLTAEVKTNFGPMTLGFIGDVYLVEKTPFKRMKLRGRSRGTAELTFDEKDHQTVLTFTVMVNIGGRFGRLGDGVAKTFAKGMLSAFFADLEVAARSKQQSDPLPVDA